MRTRCIRRHQPVATEAEEQMSAMVAEVFSTVLPVIQESIFHRGIIVTDDVEALINRVLITAIGSAIAFNAGETIPLRIGSVNGTVVCSRVQDILVGMGILKAAP